MHLHTQHINENYLQPRHSAWHIKIVLAFALVRALGFLRFNLTCPMDTRAIVYKALFGPRFRVCKDYFDSLSDRRSDERCEGAGKTACELLYSQSRVGVVGSQLFRAAGNTETGFSNLISIAFITVWQSFTKEGACQGWWGSRPYGCRRPSAYLDGFSFIWGFG